MDVYQLASAVGWLPLILSRIKSSCLEEVEFGIKLSQSEQLDPNYFRLSYDHLFACGIGFKRGG